MILETRSAKPRRTLEVLTKDASGLFPLLVAPGVPCLVAASPRFLPLSSRGLHLLHLAVSQEDTIGFRSHPDNPE